MVWPKDSISYNKFLPGKIIAYVHGNDRYVSYLGTIPSLSCQTISSLTFWRVREGLAWYTSTIYTMKCLLQSMSGTLLGTCRKMSATVQNLTTKCQLLVKLSYLQMLGTYPTAGIHETVRKWNVLYMTYSRYTWNCQEVKCPIHDLQQVYTKLSGIEMSYTWPRVHKNGWLE